MVPPAPLKRPVSWTRLAGWAGDDQRADRGGQRERRVLARVSRAGWRLEQAERERTWALVSARAEGISIRTLAAAAGLSPSRVHQLVADADLDVLDAALGELRAAGWPAPKIRTPGRTPNSAAGTASPAGYPMR